MKTYDCLEYKNQDRWRTNSYVNISGEDQKEAILFLHGSGPGVTAWSNWQFALPALDGQFHCLAPDLAGFGATDHPKHIPIRHAQLGCACGWINAKHCWMHSRSRRCIWSAIRWAERSRFIS